MTGVWFYCPTPFPTPFAIDTKRSPLKAPIEYHPISRPTTPLQYLCTHQESKDLQMKVFKAFHTALFISIALHGANAGLWGSGKQDEAPLDRHLESRQENLSDR
jgi:hypothetical protein